MFMELIKATFGYSTIYDPYDIKNRIYVYVKCTMYLLYDTETESNIWERQSEGKFEQ